MLKGSCLCGGVRYEIAGKLTGVRNCHCSMCRKAHSAAFRSRASVKTADFRWTAGEELLSWYESSPGTHRGFCSRCGSALLSHFDESPGVCGLPIGCLDTDPGVKPTMHIFVDSKAPWYEITDSLPQYPDWPPR
jgi:hypothetical protein